MANERQGQSIMANGKSIKVSAKQWAKLATHVHHVSDALEELHTIAQTAEFLSEIAGDRELMDANSNHPFNASIGLADLTPLVMSRVSHAGSASRDLHNALANIYVASKPKGKAAS